MSPRLLFTAILLALAGSVFAEPQPASRFAWQILPAREISPRGWLRQDWMDDFRVGLPGRLDTINGDVAGELFAAQNRGIRAEGRPTWWSGEQEAYWHEAYIHAAFQVGDAAAVQRVTEYVGRILRTQQENGYLGIYRPDTRLLPPSSAAYGEGGGELHTQAHLFMALLAFYEHTGREDVLRAVEKAAQLTMKTYTPEVFGTAGARTKNAGGNSHIVSFVDPMVQLYRITGDERYLRYLETMYASYSQHPPRDHDLHPSVLDDPQQLFQWHGAHTTESFHWVSALALAGDERAKRRADASLAKLGRQLTPGGALVCDEMVKGRLGNGHEMYEYCTQAELIKSLTWITQYSGNPLAAERAARLFLNASLGARLHPFTALQYLSRDDRLDIPTWIDKDAIGKKEEGSHFQLSSIIRPTCCPASAGRPVAYYLSSAWMKRPDGRTLALMNFMPSEVKTTVAGVAVQITEETQYPFSDDIDLAFVVAQPVEFSLALRQPVEGSIDVQGVAAGEQQTRDGFLIIRRTWHSGDRVHLTLRLPVRLEQTQDGTAWYYRRGALTFALPFKSEVKAVAENPNWRTHAPSGLYEYDVRVSDKSAWGYRIDRRAEFMVVALPGDPRSPWTRPTVGLRGTMLDGDGKPVTVTLVPEAASLSRRVTFLDETHSSAEAAKLPAGTQVSLGN